MELHGKARRRYREVIDTERDQSNKNEPLRHNQAKTDWQIVLFVIESVLASVPSTSS